MQCRTESPLEERLNVVTHATGLVASLAALPVLIDLAAARGDGWVVLGICVFGITLVSVYAASTMYHAVRPGARKDFWLRIDFAAIYLLIAGTYTPFMLGALRGPFGVTMLGLVWVAAAAGIAVKLRLGPRYPNLSTVAYLALGWLAVAAIGPMAQTICWEGLRWVFAGGVAYTLGVITLVCQHRLKFGHCAWHVFVLGGSACHVVAVIYGIQLPR